MPKLLAVACLVLFSMFSFAQEEAPLAAAGVTTCDSPSGGISKSVLSIAGHSAAVELHSKISGKANRKVCTTTWALVLRGENSAPKRLVVAEREDRTEDNEWSQENSFEINAWSPDGELLLASQMEAQGDWDETTPIIYDFKTNRRWRIPLQPLFEESIPKDCHVVYRPIRFEGKTAIVIQAMSTDSDREEGTPPCFASSLWKLDFEQKKITRMTAHSD